MKRVPNQFHETLKSAIFKHEIGIRQYNISGAYIEPLKLDLEWTFYIYENRFSVMRNRFHIYGETLEKAKYDLQI